MAAQFVTLDEVIQGLLVDEGKSSEHEYLRYFNIGLRGLKELNFDTVRQIKSVELQLDSKNTVTLPSDYVSYIKIGVADNNGNVSYMIIVCGVDMVKVEEIMLTDIIEKI